MSYTPTIPDWFLTRKAAQVTAFFALKAGGDINILKTTKLIYLSDRLSMKQRDFPVTNDQYVSMPFGPVNSYTYSYIQGNAPTRQEEWQEYISPRSGNNLRLSQQVSFDVLDELSRNDMRILDEVWSEFSDTDRFDLVQWTHVYCPEWRNPNGSSIPMELATIFHVLNKSNPIELAEDLQIERAMLSANGADGR